MIVVASSNEGKILEFNRYAKESGCETTFLSMNEYMRELDIDVPEDKTTFFGNAMQKAEALYDKIGCNPLIKGVMADDSGICVDVLDGDPNTRTKRMFEDMKHSVYSNEVCAYHEIKKNYRTADERNVQAMLWDIGKRNNREATFECHLVLLCEKGTIITKGIVPLNIATEPRGENGFAYDTILELNGKTFAEMTDTEKAYYNPRKVAFDNLMTFL